jgi:hypothetical protein
MNRTNQILAGVLALQIVLVAVMFWPRPAASVTSGEPLFPGIEADQIVRITVSDATGNQIQLAKSMGTWVLPEADDYPTQEKKVPELLDKIVALKTSRLVTQMPSSHKRLKVADNNFERRIEFELADGTKHRLYLGTSPRYQVTHVRADNQNEVYLASNLSASEIRAQASAWVNTLYLSIPQEQIVGLTLENKNGRFEFEKDDAGTWTMKDLAPDEKFNENNVKSLVARLSSLQMLRPLGKVEQDAYGLKEPNAVVTVKTRDKEGNIKTYSLRVGAKSEEDNSFVVISSESPYYVRMAEYTVKDFVERTRQDFLELPPTPTPAPTPTP